MSDYPQSALTLFATGNQLMGDAENDKAIACFIQALEIAPDFAEVMINLAYLQEQIGAWNSAEFWYQQAITVRPDVVQTYLNLGAMLMARDRFDEAENVYRQCLLFTSDSPALWSNLGVLLACTKREEEAEDCYRNALNLDQDYAKARFNLAYILLRQGRYAEGWPCMEARDWITRISDVFTCQHWQGGDLSGKSIVIGFEAGHGDMIQFCRYAVLLREKGATKVTLICHPGLKRLFASLAGVDEILSLDDNLSNREWDFWTLPMSLPFHFETRLDTIPATIPYLHADADVLQQWSEKWPAQYSQLSSANQKRVGLVWKGNSRFENDAHRSLPSVTYLTPVLKVLGIQFVSLQKELDGESIPESFSVLMLGDCVTDFADTAAIIKQLDLVISVDTAVAHLAGALGVPCWLLVPDYKPDWRWLAHRQDSPWYPHQMRLFRQDSAGRWDAVMDELAAALAIWVKDGKTFS
ncbi:hypothetical protein AAKU61_002719 [Undibacterium sp. GrIS 1.2]|uniref:tetratricopeptide repeat-containing glycosyltransferase family protein n=1 Tax=Undibacterium sp. GrIS 1.2 TaxID=3143933 RepID=UPI003398F041